MKIMYRVSFIDDGLAKDTNRLSDVIKYVEDLYFYGKGKKIIIESYDEDDVELPIGL